MGPLFMLICGAFTQTQLMAIRSCPLRVENEGQVNVCPGSCSIDLLKYLQNGSVCTYGDIPKSVQDFRLVSGFKI